MRHSPPKQLSLHVRFSENTHERIAHHANRLGVALVDIVRDGALQRIRELDAEEAAVLAAKEKRIDLRNLRDKGRTTMPIPPRIEKRFDAYAEALEECETEKEREECSKNILSDIHTRCTSSEEERRVHEALKEFLTSRKTAKESVSPEKQLVTTMKGY